MIQPSNTQLELIINKESFSLLAEKAIYWKEEKALLISDLHLGKGGHFRRAGIPIPRTAFLRDIERLDALLKEYDVVRMIFLGDLFHSLDNAECAEAADFFKAQSHIKFQLVPGNHDILSAEKYEDYGLEVLEEDYRLRAFRFVHEPVDSVEGYFLFCGHIHPGAILAGTRIPCFWKSENSMILPAFGSFTGSVRVKIKKGDSLYGVVEDTVWEI